MKKRFHVFLVMAVFAAMLVSACGAISSSTATSSGAGKPEASLVEFTGVIESIDGNQWVVNGQTITVDPAILSDGPFAVGDTVKVEAKVQTDGSVVVTSVEPPSSDDDSNENSNDDSNDDSSNTAVDPTAGIVFDDNGSDAFGTVESISGDTITIGGETFTIANGAEFKDLIEAGSFVKVNFILNADGTMSIQEIELWDPALVGDDNSNGIDDNSNDLNSNDDNDNDDNSNDDEDNSNDDDNDDNGNDDGSNDDDSSDDDSGDGD